LHFVFTSNTTTKCKLQFKNYFRLF
jgi:hypothetical protein